MRTGYGVEFFAKRGALSDAARLAFQFKIQTQLLNGRTMDVSFEVCRPVLGRYVQTLVPTAIVVPCRRDVS